MHQRVFCRAGDFEISTTAGVVAELRNILRERNGGRGASRCRFDRRFGKKLFYFVGDATQVYFEVLVKVLGVVVVVVVAAAVVVVVVVVIVVVVVVVGINGSRS